MSDWCRNCGGPLKTRLCANCGSRTFEERRNDAEQRSADFSAVISAFVRRHVSGETESAFDSLVDHLLPPSGPRDHRLLFEEHGKQWRLVLVVSDRPTFVEEVPPEVAVHFVTILHLLSRNELGVQYLSKLSPASVTPTASGYSICREA